MPSRPAKACRQPGCKNPAQAGQHQGFCEQHKDRAGWHGNERVNGNRHQRGYGSHWDKIRKQILARDGHLCQECKRKGRYVSGTHVDHIKPKAQGGSDSHTNLQTLCVECHKTKTAKERI